ncbi:hypothetical protein ASZ78_005690 [Callipepla squamata]|uniref:Uncharacterized protein n=1 Tax=Callipepla squamata TaxID=9009 RepID=A0A226NIC4_CALSU|nr:hypothetical protein ASZ78_005690 [Callipepla squamata]
MSLDRKLLMAVTPWVGNVLLPCTLQTGKMAFYQTKAYSIQQKLKSVSLSSTPLFTLFIQASQNSETSSVRNFPTSCAGYLIFNSYKMSLKSFFLFEDLFFFSLIHLTGNASQQTAPRVQTAAPPLPPLPALPAQAQRQKPKTVSELLREKRQREKAMRTAVFVAPQMVLSGPLVIQHSPQQVIPSAQVGSKPGAAGCADSQGRSVPAPPSAFASVAGSAASPAVLENHSPSVPEVGESSDSSQQIKVQSNKEPNEQAPQSTSERGVLPGPHPAAAGKAPDQGGCNGQVPSGSLAPVVLENQAFMPRRVTVVPFGTESGNSRLPLPAPITFELRHRGPVSIVPALLTPQPGSCLTPDSTLPLTWILTQQALMPSSVQPILGAPQGLPAATVRSQSQASVTSSGSASGLGVPPVSTGVNMPQPSHTETETSPQLAAAIVTHSTSVLPVSSADPVCSMSAVSAPSDSPSRTADSSAAQNALPGCEPTPRAQLLPHVQLPAGAQGSDSHCVTGGVSLGRNQDSSTTNGSSSNSSVLKKGVVLQPGASIPHNSVAENSEGSSAQALKYRPIASKPPAAQTAGAPPQPNTSSAEKTLLDYSLISLEDEELVKEWLSGKQGVHVPPLQTRLPYFPPFLCNIKALSRLLLQKAALEKQAARLLSPDGSEGEVDLNAITELVHEKLGNDPAFLLLKARFLAAFTLPAVLATLPPPKVATTLSASRREYGESDEEEWQSEEEAPEDESCGDELDAQSDGTVGDEPGDRDADSPDEGMGTEEIAAQSIVDTCTDGTASVPQIRRSARVRKRIRKRRRV